MSLYCAAKQADPREKSNELSDEELEPLKLKVLCEKKDILGEKECSEKLQCKEPAQQSLFVDRMFCRSFFFALNPYLPEKDFFLNKQIFYFDTRFSKDGEKVFNTTIPGPYIKEAVLEL
ncbi:hypothetical protein [Sedimentisphaera cyanobacteriorum]|uniref:hypothetical protein n=1 Tax=Sedimentisphaera cyanobacteriorum TaxID=1940790 RepID=UPI000F4E9B3D|nr:hypothetical protein [Sedimentisphaera cyanobacteriorum]